MARSGIDRESEAVKSSYRFAIYTDIAVGLHGYGQLVHILADVAQQNGSAAVDETLRQRGVQRIGQFFLQRARPFGHFGGVGQPVGAMGDIGPCPRRRDPARQRVNIALHRIEPGELLGEPVARNMAVSFRQKLPDAIDRAGMMIRAQFLKVGQAARIPQPGDLSRGAHPVDDLRVSGHALQHGKVDRFRRGAQFGAVGSHLQIGDQCRQTVEPGCAVAPV